jgi:carboxyl-terminal processing protease
MRRRACSASFGLLLAVWLGWAATPVAAQPTVSLGVSPRSDQVNDALDRGRQLEVERRWGEALTHYEDAIRLYPGNPALQRRYDFARQHYDLGRRYADRSFSTSLDQLSFGKALDLYAQVLLKIQSHYVDVPNWKGLVDHGTLGLQTALGEKVFLDRHVAQPAQAGIEPFERELTAVLGPRTIATRHEARDAVAVAASLAQQRLGIAPTAIVLEYLCGATNALDPYSAYLTPDQLAEVYSQIEGNFVGLGVELKAQDGALTVIRVIPGSPAQQAGIRAGDQIVSVEGQATRALSTDQAANMLQGPEGTLVNVTVASPGAEPRQLTVRRQRVDVPSIDKYEMLDSQYGIAYLHLSCFQKTTCRDLDATLWKLHRDGMKCLVIDVRGNPGGLLTTAVDVADRFVERGIIVSTRGRSLQEDFTYAAHVEGTWRVPLVVLIDHNSASAAEIFAGAIRDHRRGTVVGVRSFGKGSVQGIFPLDGSASGVRLTTAKFYSPTGRPYNNVGVEPDVVVQTAAKPVEGRVSADEDAMLQAALQAARHATTPAPAPATAAAAKTAG